MEERKAERGSGRREAKEAGQQLASKEHRSGTERASEGEKIEKKRGWMRGVSLCLLEVEPRAIWSVRVIPCLRLASLHRLR